MVHVSGVSKGGLRVLEHPPQLWHNSQISSSVATIYADNRQLVARTKNKLTGLYNSLSKQLFLVATWPNSLLCQPAIFKNALARGVVNVLGGVA